MRRTVLVLQSLLVLTWLSTSAGALRALLALSDASRDEETAIVRLAVTGTLAVLAFSGIVLVRFHPGACAIGLALVGCLVAAGAWWIGPMGLAAGVTIPALLFVAMIPAALQASRAIRAEPELALGERRKSRRRKPPGDPQSSERRSWRFAFAAGITGIAMVSLGGWTVHARVRPPELGEALTRFRERWNASRPDLLAGVFTTRLEAGASWLESVAERRGWGLSWPVLHDSVVVEHDGRTATVDYAMGDGSLRTEWALESNVWVATGIAPPPPPFDPVQRFVVEAWSAGDSDALADLSTEGRDSLNRTILEELLAEAPTMTKEPYVNRPSARRRWIELEHPTGAVVLRFLIEADRWRLDTVDAAER